MNNSQSKKYWETFILLTETLFYIYYVDRGNVQTKGSRIEK